MGAPATRITAADFHIPPELASYRLAPNGAGRIGGVRLELTGHSDSTRLGSCYQQVPLRVLPPFHFDAKQPSLLYLLNPTAGLLDGDAQLVEVMAKSGSRTLIVGQSATRIHPSVHAFATQQWRVRVEKDATLMVLPGPAIPFAGCRYYQRIDIDIEEGGTLIWGDIWLAGRYARGTKSEYFEFDRIIQEMRVRRVDTLVFRDRFDWRGPWDREMAAWQFGEFPACGSLFATGPLARAMETALAGVTQAAVFATAAGDTCCRIQGSSEAVVRSMVAAALGRLDLRSNALHSTPDLAPNHWFASAASDDRSPERLYEKHLFAEPRT